MAKDLHAVSGYGPTVRLRPGRLLRLFEVAPALLDEHLPNGVDRERKAMMESDEFSLKSKITEGIGFGPSLRSRRIEVYVSATISAILTITIGSG